MISHMDHIVLTVADIERSVNFYQQVLCMSPITLGANRRAVAFGQQRIVFQLLGEEMRNHALEGSGYLCLKSDWLMPDVITHLKQSGVMLLDGPKAQNDGLSDTVAIHIHDPDSNLIKIIARSGE